MSINKIVESIRTKVQATEKTNDKGDTMVVTRLQFESAKVVPPHAISSIPDVKEHQLYAMAQLIADVAGIDTVPVKIDTEILKVAHEICSSPFPAPYDVAKKIERLVKAAKAE